MRALKRGWRRAIGEIRIAKRQEEVAAAIGAHFKLSKAPRLVLSGARGADSNYFVYDGGKRLGVLRLINPYKKREVPPENLPFRLEAGKARIDREWNAYRAGSAEGLTPKPLWRGDDFLLCEYLPLRPLQDALEKNPAKAWNLLLRGAKVLQALHQCSITHMDASLANILGDPDGGRAVFIDFEYAPAPGISFAAQKLYDHLRLVESTWKFIPRDKRGDTREWLDFVASCVGEVKKSDLELLALALTRILAYPQLSKAIREKMTSLPM